MQLERGDSELFRHVLRRKAPLEKVTLSNPLRLAEVEVDEEHYLVSNDENTEKPNLRLFN